MQQNFWQGSSNKAENMQDNKNPRQEKSSKA